MDAYQGKVLNSNSWQFVECASDVQLPSKYSEIYVRVTPSASGDNWFRSMIIPRIALASYLTQYLTGDYAGAYGSCKVGISASNTKVQLDSVFDNGTDVTSNSAMYVYVR